VYAFVCGLYNFESVGVWVQLFNAHGVLYKESRQLHECNSSYMIRYLALRGTLHRVYHHETTEGGE
jgi:hypothetical protein